MKLVLQVHLSPGKSSRWESTATHAVLGRDAQCELSFPESTSDVVSWRHARIEFVDGSAILTDLGSTNGTWLNGRRINGPEPLRIGDEIRLALSGPRLVALEMDAAPSATPAPPAAAGADDRRGAPAMASSHPPAQSPGNVWRAGLILCAAGGLSLGLVVASMWLSSGTGAAPAVMVDATESQPSLSIDPVSLAPSSAGVQAADDVERAATAQAGAVVWLGLEAKGLRFPLFTGWCVTPRHVVTTGYRIHHLALQARQLEGVGQIFVFNPQRPDQLCYVESFCLPAEFNPDDPNAVTTQFCNFGVARCATELPISCRVASPDELAEAARAQLPVSAVAFSITREMWETDLADMPHDSRPAQYQLHGVIEQVEPAPGAAERRRLLTSLEPRDGLDGAPLFGFGGNVIAIAQRDEDRVYGVVLDDLQELLE